MAELACYAKPDDLIDAIRQGSAETVQSALAVWGDDLNRTAADGESPLVACAEVGRTALLSSLLKANASPDSASSSGLSGLAAASLHGHLSCVQILLQAKGLIRPWQVQPGACNAVSPPCPKSENCTP